MAQMVHLDVDRRVSVEKGKRLGGRWNEVGRKIEERRKEDVRRMGLRPRCLLATLYPLTMPNK